MFVESTEELGVQCDHVKVKHRDGWIEFGNAERIAGHN